jgi:hypothetical protein
MSGKAYAGEMGMKAVVSVDSGMVDANAATRVALNRFEIVDVTGPPR